ncbi:hypothetical protein B0H19DRAFT_1328711 [Mycena capillaripes]|nr:hypothetical protein B0H19DRAFT_1328711 [Mycena capillaripes]
MLLQGNRLTLSKLTTAYVIFSIVHFALQRSLQIRAFTINADAAALLYSIAPQGNATNSSFPTLSYPEIRMCANVPTNLDTTHCTPVYDGTPNNNTKVVTEKATPTGTSSSSLSPNQSPNHKHALPQLKIFVLSDESVLVNITGYTYHEYPLNLTRSCMWSLNWPVSILDNTKREDIVFTSFQFWVLGMSLVALLNESIPHILASLLTHVLATEWSGFQISHTANFHNNFDSYITHGACAGVPSFLPTYWQDRADLEYPTFALNIAALFISCFLTWKLVKLFGWQTFKRVGASLTIGRVYKLVLTLSIVLQLSLFFMGATVSLFLDQLFNGLAGRLAWHPLLYKINFIITGVPPLNGIDYDYSSGDSNHQRRDSETNTIGNSKRWVIDD